MSTSKKRKLVHKSVGAPRIAVPANVESQDNTPPSIEVDANQTQDESKTEEAAKTFRELGIIEELCEACDRLGYKAPTPIQAQSIPVALQSRDIIGMAKTGSGKTAAFVLPILQALMDKPQPFHSLILAPTRELAYQIAQVVEALGSIIQVRCTVLVGGMDMIPQSIALGKKPHVIVATPGRLLDHLESTKGFSLRHLKYLVMDEADRLLDMDFGPILDKLLKILPRENRRTYLFSATITSKVESLQRASLSNPVPISVSSDKFETVSTLLQSFLLIPMKYKDVYLVHVLNEFPGQTGIIFTRTVNEAQRVSIMLKQLGFSAIPIHGQLSQRARLEALNKFRAKSRTLLVASNVAARGLDIPNVDLVLNYDVPDEAETYVHRVGRTARAGKSGNAISFVTQYDFDKWAVIEDELGKKFDEHECVKEEVMVLADRVNDAQRVAAVEMKDLHDNRGKKGATLRNRKPGNGNKRGRDRIDTDDG